MGFKLIPHAEIPLDTEEHPFPSLEESLITEQMSSEDITLICKLIKHTLRGTPLIFSQKELDALWQIADSMNLKV